MHSRFAQRILAAFRLWIILRHKAFDFRRFAVALYHQMEGQASGNLPFGMELQAAAIFDRSCTILQAPGKPRSRFVQPLSNVYIFSF